ncbi:TetR/AcrR family transcriptional regulator C-terminal ligand-binding domain-containing protein [Parahaliea sp. F7430]|uniref:TetR/AcrR family transcriptional regulator C-terminal ligand-binding domain-containing protein n=1 Tax=Sediminihaliea albiluteola TaxID=2758564 RepID=A0A7W2TTS2_9GAMM|nr:TetR-like C-terminal domain-containing protein [Sediminihaliea albiluteola]MBA6411791.1 TetR/AcrR family transcriptional regulator C-terminal ligand-binding domain-containing protein [Sediminihaliea albiluteola]
MTNTKPRSGDLRPGGRTREIKNNVATSVLELIKSGNIQFSYSELAAASGVHKTTLYRRWPTHIDLIRVAIEIHNQSFSLESKNNWHDNAEAIVRSLADFLSDPTEVAINRALLANPQAAESLVSVEYWQPIQNLLKSMVVEAQAAGELAEDIDPQTVIMTIVSPLIISTTLGFGTKSKETLITQLSRLARSYAYSP